MNLVWPFEEPTLESCYTCQPGKVMRGRIIQTSKTKTRATVTIVNLIRFQMPLLVECRVLIAQKIRQQMLGTEKRLTGDASANRATAT